MSTASLPTYAPPPTDFARTPTYSAEPQAYEQRLALNLPTARPSSDFVKQAKNVGLRLFAQENNASLPVYGCGADVEGAITLAKTEGITSVEAKIEGNLILREVAAGGTTAHKLCLSRVTLWSKDSSTEPCPRSLKFCLTLPTTFNDEKDTYPLPPTHNVHLAGMPGFNATIEYRVSAIVSYTKAATVLRLGNGTVSTPFVYLPRSRPAVPLPPPMRQGRNSSKFIEDDDWRLSEAVMKARLAGGKDIHCQFYIPATRVFSVTEAVPFHVMFQSSAFSLAAFLPYGPTASILAPNKQFTRVRVLRQSIVDVRNELISGTKTDMWRVDTIGEGEFRHAGDGPDWLCFSGEIRLDKGVKVGGFKAGGLNIKDFIELSMIPPEPARAPFSEMRLVIPIRLTTDPWSSDGSTAHAIIDDFSTPSPPSERA
ncbi:uncharacterized protein BXZ73DRAFT_51201 [Epithele typhae]|uniref:uncharacterized protein n=1 Tax=Epithele typhae TaxID=378194 RepID=UPI0020089E9D|nr:uncharacterized protein BXZ73DRAFT_51201 [Epithele typhae]KAH9922872.1 hypothetical protein BXZ73DRAFT_51201 [Epithele typhae]